MGKISVVTAPPAEDRAEAEYGDGWEHEALLGDVNEKKGSRITELATDKLKRSLQELTQSLDEVFDTEATAGSKKGFQLKEITVQVEITAEGGFNLIGMASKAAAKGAVTLRFQKE